MSASRQNFISAHWDWLVAFLGVAAFVAAGAMFVMKVGDSPEDSAAVYEASLNAVKPSRVGVAPADLGVLAKSLRGVRTPPALSAIEAKKASFLASERRVVCRAGDAASAKQACGKPIPAGLEVCPFCRTKQTFVKIEVDTDHDGLPNDWEKKYGLNPADPSDAAKDADGDGFTNLEEFQAKTDPRDPKSHPDYLDSVTVAGGVRRTSLPFYFNTVMPIPGGHRFTFQRMDEKGRNLAGFDAKASAKINEEIQAGSGKNVWKSGWKVVAYTKKTEKRKVEGTNVSKPVDVSTVEVQRLADGKKLVARIDARGVAVESQAELRYNRGEGRSFIVSEGTEFELNGSKFRVVKLRGTANECEVTILDLGTKKEKIVR